jgi:phosphate starvation-inducible PhoH-like protein
LGKHNLASEFTLEPQDHRRLLNLCGQFNEHIHYLEQNLGVEINNHGCNFCIIGIPKSIQLAKDALLKLYNSTASIKQLTIEQIKAMMQPTTVVPTNNKNYATPKIKQKSQPAAEIVSTPLLKIKPRNNNQQHYIDAINNFDINFGIGPSGTGKTFIAVACAVAALEAQEVKKIILVRPAVEAGEKLGFLPGDLSEKVDPYLRPLYDALYQMLGATTVNKYIAQNIIEIAPLAYMRGRTLNDAFIILDESQNTTQEQMKMLLTRIGFGSKAIITGDITQIDLPKHVKSGLRHAIEVLCDVAQIKFTFFMSADVVRHPLVAAIVAAYEKYETIDA